MSENKAELESAKLPTYVTHKGADGRRYFTDAFKRAVVADFQSGRATANELGARFKLFPSLIHLWVRNYGGKKAAKHAASGTNSHKAAVRTITVPASAKPATLLQRALKREVGPDDTLERYRTMTHEHLELAVAFLEGHVSRAALSAELRERGKNRFNSSAWLGAVLKWAWVNGYRLKKEKP